jgi:hypothetical protein
MYRTTIGGLAATAALAVLATPAMAAPGNDDFEHAQPVGAMPAAVSGTLDGATAQPDTPHPQSTDVWYSVTPTTTGPLSVELPVLTGSVSAPPAVYTGPDRSHLTPVTQDPDAWYGRVHFDAVAGQTYWIQVGGSQGAGAFRLDVRPATAPANDAFADARRIRVPGLYSGNLEDATTELGEPATSGGSTVWYRIRPAHSGRLTADVGDSACDASVAAFTGSDLGELHPVGRERPTIRFAAQRGRTYRLRVACSGGVMGTYTLDVSDGSIEGKGVQMSVVPGQTVDGVRAHGLRLDVSARRKVGVAIDLLVSSTTRRRLGLADRVIGHVRGTLGYGQKAPATIRLERSARRALAGHDRLDATARLTLLDNAPNRVLERPVRLRATMGA